MSIRAGQPRLRRQHLLRRLPARPRPPRPRADRQHPGGGADRHPHPPHRRHTHQDHAVAVSRHDATVVSPAPYRGQPQVGGDLHRVAVLQVGPRDHLASGAGQVIERIGQSRRGLRIDAGSRPPRLRKRPPMPGIRLGLILKPRRLNSGARRIVPAPQQPAPASCHGPPSPADTTPRGHRVPVRTHKPPDDGPPAVQQRDTRAAVVPDRQTAPADQHSHHPRLPRRVDGKTAGPRELIADRTGQQRSIPAS